MRKSLDNNNSKISPRNHQKAEIQEEFFTWARTCLGKPDPWKNPTASAPLILPSPSKSALLKYASNWSMFGFCPAIWTDRRSYQNSDQSSKIDQKSYLRISPCPDENCPIRTDATKNDKGINKIKPYNDWHSKRKKIEPSSFMFKEVIVVVFPFFFPDNYFLTFS